MLYGVLAATVVSGVLGFVLGMSFGRQPTREAIVLLERRDEMIEALVERVASQAASIAAMKKEGWDAPERFVPVRRQDPMPRIENREILDFLDHLTPDSREVAEEWVLQQIARGIDQDVIYEELKRGGGA